MYSRTVALLIHMGNLRKSTVPHPNPTLSSGWFEKQIGGRGICFLRHVNWVRIDVLFVRSTIEHKSSLDWVLVILLLGFYFLLTRVIYLLDILYLKIIQDK